MTCKVLFIQGAGKDAHDTWDIKLVDSLKAHLGDGYEVDFPKMPNEADPHLSSWKAALHRDFKTMNEGDILVGHSAGGAILLHTLADQAPPFIPGALVFLAIPYIGEGGWPSQDLKPRDDFADALPVGVPVLMYHGTEDGTVPFVHTRLYAKAIPQAVITPLKDADHQFKNDLSQVAKDIRALDKR